MNSLRYLYDRQVRYIVAAVVLLLATIAPSIAMAAQVTERSIEVSSSTVSATGVSYKVAFNAISAAESFVIDFCANSPLVGQECDAPAGLNVSAAASTDVTIGTNTNNKIAATESIAAGPVEFEFTGITNPSAQGTIYARIVTFAASGGAASYISDTPGTVADSGSVAIAFTNSIGVTADVLESLTFCVSGQAPAAACTSVTPSNLVLGDDLGNGVIALGTAAPSTGDVFTQISTNAAAGAVVNLKSNATGCGGLLRLGAPGECNITPVGTSGSILTGQAQFGVRAVAAADPAGNNSEGAYQIHPSSSYDDTDFRMNYVDANSGVTSVYGDPFLDTDGEPALNKNMQLTFGAQAANNTPAGRYQATLNLIATGKF